MCTTQEGWKTMRYLTTQKTASPSNLRSETKILFHIPFYLKMAADEGYIAAMYHYGMLTALPCGLPRGHPLLDRPTIRHLRGRTLSPQQYRSRPNHSPRPEALGSSRGVSAWVLCSKDVHVCQWVEVVEKGVTIIRTWAWCFFTIGYDFRGGFLLIFPLMSNLISTTCFTLFRIKPLGHFQPPFMAQGFLFACPWPPPPSFISSINVQLIEMFKASRTLPKQPPHQVPTVKIMTPCHASPLVPPDPAYALLWAESFIFKFMRSIPIGTFIADE